MYLLTFSLHKDAVNNSEHASIALNGPTTVDEMWMWSWSNLTYYSEIRMEGPQKPMTYVSVYCWSPTVIQTGQVPTKSQKSISFVRYANVSG
jgi:hypothetical protein